MERPAISAAWGRSAGRRARISSVRAVTKWDGNTSARRSNQNALTWVRTAPLRGIGSRITTSNALTRSLATSRRWSASTS